VIDFFANRGGTLDSISVCEEMTVLAVFDPSEINHLESRFRKPVDSWGRRGGLRMHQFLATARILLDLSGLGSLDSAVSTRENGSLCEVLKTAR
jgi:hypothetical protein